MNISDKKNALEVLSLVESKEVSGGIGLLGATKIVGRTASSLGLLSNVGPDGLFRPSKKPASGRVCCCNCRTM